MKAFYRNFGHPRGILGWLVGHAMARKNRERSEWALGHLAPRPGERILEVGFGPGVDVARLLASTGTSGFVAGADPSREMVRHASARNRAAIRAGRAQLEQAEVAALPFADASFDAVYSVNSAFFWPDLALGMRETARVLRTPGRALVVLQPLWRGASAAEAAQWGERVAAAMHAAGLVPAVLSVQLASGAAVAVRGERSGD